MTTQEEIEERARADAEAAHLEKKKTEEENRETADLSSTSPTAAGGSDRGYKCFCGYETTQQWRCSQHIKAHHGSFEEMRKVTAHFAEIKDSLSSESCARIADVIANFRNSVAKFLSEAGKTSQELADLTPDALSSLLKDVGKRKADDGADFGAEIWELSRKAIGNDYAEPFQVDGGWVVAASNGDLVPLFERPKERVLQQNVDAAALRAATRRETIEKERAKKRISDFDEDSNSQLRTERKSDSSSTDFGVALSQLAKSQAKLTEVVSRLASTSSSDKSMGGDAAETQTEELLRRVGEQMADATGDATYDVLGGKDKILVKDPTVRTMTAGLPILSLRSTPTLQLMEDLGMDERLAELRPALVQIMQDNHHHFAQRQNLQVIWDTALMATQSALMHSQPLQSFLLGVLQSKLSEDEQNRARFLLHCVQRSQISAEAVWRALTGSKADWKQLISIQALFEGNAGDMETHMGKGAIFASLPRGGETTTKKEKIERYESLKKSAAATAANKNKGDAIGNGNGRNRNGNLNKNKAAKRKAEPSPEPYEAWRKHHDTSRRHRDDRR